MDRLKRQLEGLFVEDACENLRNVESHVHISYMQHIGERIVRPRKNPNNGCNSADSTIYLDFSKYARVKNSNTIDEQRLSFIV